MAKILIIESEQSMGRRLARTLSEGGHDVQVVRSLTEALLADENVGLDAVIAEAAQIAQDPSNALSWLRERESGPEVVILADGLDDGLHQQILEAGAWDILPRLKSTEKIHKVLSQVLEFRSSKRSETGTLEEAVSICPGLISDNKRFLDKIELCCEAARTDVNVLIEGETGTGKELFAQVIHGMSRRSKSNLVLVDCASLPDNLVESTLFGHIRGSFTGADRTQEGLIAHADGGTLFLDEVGELPLLIQKSFLRVLDEHRYRPVGSKTLKKSDFRVIAATNRDLEAMAAKNLFREDLLHRLMVMTIHVPSLRDRREDIPLLAEHHLRIICRKHGVPRVRQSADFTSALTQYRWPGNVRELIHSLERAVVAARGSDILYPVHLPTHIRSQQTKAEWTGEGTEFPAAGPIPPREAGPPRGTTETMADQTSRQDPLPPLKDERARVIGEMEKEYLSRLMEVTGGRIEDAVRISGLSRSRLYALMNQYGIRARR